MSIVFGSADTTGNERHRRRWTKAERRRLGRSIGNAPLDLIARQQGRTTSAIIKQTVNIKKPAELISMREFGRRLGINKQAAARLATGKPYCTTYYRRNRPTKQVDAHRFVWWLSDPLNWKNLDTQKIIHPEWCSIVQHALCSSLDRYLTIGEAATYANYSSWGISKAIRTDRLASERGTFGRKGPPIHLIQRSVLDKFIANGGNWKRYEQETC
ncbi:MAG: hypothetical protein ACPG8W_01670 [Candidatus Promineifilaceae bacterium]